MNTHSWQFVVLTSLVIWYLSAQAGRLDRLHHRIDVAQAALDTHLARRAGVVAELANTEVLDLATAAMLTQGAHDALAAGDLDDPRRLEAEGDLSEVLLAALDGIGDFESDDSVAIGLLGELGQVCKRVQMSHKFHTDAVTDCLNIRRQILVRALFLAGRAPLPQALNFRDDLPSVIAN